MIFFSLALSILNLGCDAMKDNVIISVQYNDLFFLLDTDQIAHVVYQIAANP